MPYVRQRFGWSGGCGCGRTQYGCRSRLGEWYVRGDDEEDERAPAAASPPRRTVRRASPSLACFGEAPAAAVALAQGGAAKKEWFVLKPPPAIKQELSTCWAASLASWLSVKTGLPPLRVSSIVARYAGTPCLTSRNALPSDEAAFQVFGEWGVAFMQFEGRLDSLWYDKLRDYLRRWGHLILVEPTRLGMNHVSVIYAVGFNDKRKPERDWFSTMDPLPAHPAYRNRYLGSLQYPVYIGYSTRKGPPAACIGRPREMSGALLKVWRQRA
jgi:hypothetical protein